jgi:hypothetical protein
VHSGPKHKFCLYLRNEGKQNALKHPETSFWVQFTRMDASQLWYPEIVHSDANTGFSSFYVQKVSEMLWNTPKHLLVPMEYNSCFATLVPQNSAFRPETQLFLLFMCRRLAKCSETLSNIFRFQWSIMDASQSWYPEIVHSGPKHKFFLLFTCWSLEKCSETLPNIILVPMELNGCFTTWVPWNSPFSPETRVFHLFTGRRFTKCSEAFPNIILGQMD